MRIHSLQTGTVRVKPSQRVGRGHGPIRQLNIILDRSWTEPLPIYAWAIETADGVVVVDAGETARTREPGYFPRWHPYFRLAVRMDVAPEQEIGPKLLELGIRPHDVRTLVLTHLHTDHAGGLHHFPKSEILVSGDELALAKGFRGQLRGYLPNRWPEWFNPQIIAFEPVPFGRFDRSRRVTSDGHVVILPTPGHTPGHVSVIVVDGDVSYFLAGDTSYTQAALVEQKVDGVSPDEATALLTLQRILCYARERPTVYLPSHDSESAARLAKTVTIPVDGIVLA
jgi:N-acyl homoserine lactone hydrolase